MRAMAWASDYERLNPALKPLEPDGQVAAAFSEAARQFFVRRWSNSWSTDSRGPWRGVFASNVTLPNVQIYNTFNENDWALRLDRGRGDLVGLDVAAYFICQWNMKPYAGHCPKGAMWLIRSPTPRAGRCSIRAGAQSSAVAPATPT